MTQREIAPLLPAWIRWTIVGGTRPPVPRKVPESWQRTRAWFRPWGVWTLKGKTGPRAALAPRRPPQWAHQLVLEPDVRRNLLGVPPAPVARPPYFASHRGALLNEPDGAGWDFEAFRRDFGDWVALNLHATHGGWDDVRARAERARLEVVPWVRLGHPHLGDTKADCLEALAHLIATARAWGTKRPIVNAETEIKPAAHGGLVTPAEIAHELIPAGMAEAAISTEAWLYDMHWIPLAHYTVLPQILPRDNRWAPAEVRAQQRACIERARAYGFEHVGASVQTYEMADGTHPEPGWFDLEGPGLSLIWGDNAGDWRRWRA